MSIATSHSAVALLAPVPFEHLKSGVLVSGSQGKVAFGSKAWEVFYTLRELLDGGSCDVVIYASDVPQPNKPTIRWRADLIGFVESKNGAHPSGMKYRPASTEKYPGDNEGHWAVFWEVANLAELPKPEWIEIGKLRGLGNQQPFEPFFVPHGPTLIDPI